LAHYLKRARYAYLDTDRHKHGSDLILDGCCDLQALRAQVLQRLDEEPRVSETRHPGFESVKRQGPLSFLTAVLRFARRCEDAMAAKLETK